MKNVSVKEIAARWNIAERSVRRYCEHGQSNGAASVDGVWIIPDDTLNYLQSRYHNPYTGRFINADALVSTG